MDTSVYNVINNVENKNAVAELQKLQLTNLQNVIRSYHPCSYLLPRKHEEYLNNILEPSRIIYTHTPVHHSHGAAAFLNNLGYEDVNNEAARFLNVIDVGGSPLKTPNNYHMCVKIDDIRTDARYAGSAFSQLNAVTDKYDFTRYLTKNHNYCIAGAENCDYKADYGFAVNVYDIKLEQVALLMLRHGLRVFDMWLFMPLMLIDETIKVDQVLYSCERIGENVEFHLKDESSIYIHNYDTWRSYYTTTKILCNEHAFSIEMVKKYGTFIKFRFIATKLTNGIIKRCIPLTEILQTVRVPNLVLHHNKNKSCTVAWSKDVITIEKKYAENCINWLTSCSDGQFNFPAFAVYCHAIKNKIEYSQGGAVELVYKGVDIDLNEYDDVKQSLYMIGSIMRYKRFKNVGNVLNYLNKNQPDLEGTNIRLFCKHYLRKVVHSMLQTISNGITEILGMDPDVIVSESFIYNAHVLYYDDMKFSDCLDLVDNRVINEWYHKRINGLCTMVKTKQFFAPNRPVNDYNITYKKFTPPISLNLLNSTPLDASIIPPTPPPNNKPPNGPNDPDDNDPPKPNGPGGGSDNQPPPFGPGQTIKKLPDEDGSSISSYSSIDLNIDDEKVFYYDNDFCADNKLAITGISFKHEYNIVYNPSGENGECGRRVLQYANPDIFVAQEECSWMNDETMNNYLAETYNVVVHINGVPTTHYKNDAPRTICINNTGAHWTVINCNCPSDHVLDTDFTTGQPFRFTHADVLVSFEKPYDSNKLRADQNAINKLIPNLYAQLHTGNDFNHKVKRHIVQTFSKSFDIDVYIENRNASNDHAKLHSDFATLLKFLSENKDQKKHMNIIIRYSRIEGFTLACFKTMLNLFGLRYTIFHSNNRGIDYFNKAKPCTHGGYVDLNKGKDICFTKGVYDNKIWAQIPINANPPSTDRMKLKFADILSFVNNKFAITYFEKYVDLSCAPGYFSYHAPLELSKYAAKHTHTMIENYCYLGINHVDLNTKLVTPNATYTDTVQFVNRMSQTKPAKTLYMYDNNILDQPSFIKLVTKDSVLVTKLMTDPIYHDKIVLEMNTLMLDYNVDYFINDGSEFVSSEVYMLIYRADQSLTRSVTTLRCPEDKCLADFVQSIDQIQLSKAQQVQAKKICECNVAEIFNKTNDYYINYDKKKYCDFVSVYKSKNVPSAAESINIKIIDGVAGSQKTLKVKKGTCSICTLIIAPYRVIKDQSGIDYVQTYELAIDNLQRREYKYVIFDEIFVYNPTYLIMMKALAPNSTFYGMGDSKQIDNRDYDKNSCETKYQCVNYILESKRILPSVCKLLQSYIPGITTTNKNDDISVENDISKLDNIPPMDPNGKKNVILVCTQLLKNKFQKSCKANVMTVNESQGSTIDNVHFYINDIKNLPTDVIKYVYVACSRASNKLVWYGSDQEVKEVYTILNSAIDRALKCFDIPIIEIPHIEKGKREKKHYDIRTLHSMEVTQQHVEQILDKVYVAKNEVHNEIVDYKTDVLPENKNGKKFKTSFENAAGGDVRISGKRFGVRSYQKYYHGKSHKQTLDCMLHRYTKEKKPIPKECLQKLVDGFDMFMIKDWRKSMRKLVTVEEVNKSICEYIKELQKKCNGDLFTEILSSVNNDDLPEMADDIENPVQETIDAIAAKKKFRSKNENIIAHFIDCMKNGKPNKLSDLEKEWYDSYHDIVSFHLKRQPKEVRKANYDAEFKAGQGVAAWSKIMNVIFSSFTRTFTNLITKFLKKNVQWSFGASDAELSEFFMGYSDHFKVDGSKLNSKAFKKLLTDFAEFDTSQEMMSVLAAEIILRSVGFNQDILAFYRQKRSEWTMINHGEEFGVPLMILLSGVWNQHSGQPFTLSGNTLFNMAAIGMCYNIEEMACAAFKGDDAIVVARVIEERVAGTQSLIDLCGYKIKAHFVGIAEYIANIIVPYYGFFPDVLRRTSRILSKIYTIKDDWIEIRKSTADALDVISDDEHLYVGAEVAVKFYAQFGIHLTVSDILTLIKFLMQLVKLEHIEDIPTKMFTILDVSALL
jgi:hypothetical protein